MAGEPKMFRCAIYTRKSTEHGLEQEFNSLDAQRDACEAYIKSQASRGWRALPQHYDDPAYSGGNLDRPALKRLLAVCTENLNPNVLTMKSAQYGARIYDAGSLNLARDRRILVQ
ncbi:Resolvase, N terminal domain [Bradyrhizobium erythrophlei]|nr:Resolvase, N terminal domain [Bradyrhizobium erythrophlei]